MGLTGDDIAYDITINNSGEDEEEYIFTGSIFMPQSENLDIFLSVVNDNEDDPTDPTIETYYLQLDNDKTEEAYSIELAYNSKLRISKMCILNSGRERLTPIPRLTLPS